MLRKKFLPICRGDRRNRHVAAVVGCMLAAVAIPTFIWAALALGLPFMFGAGVVLFAVTSTLLWYHSFHLHGPARYCITRHAIARHAEDEVHDDTEFGAGECSRSTRASSGHDHEELLAGHRT
jgi:hypothetical protein